MGMRRLRPSISQQRRHGSQCPQCPPNPPSPLADPSARNGSNLAVRLGTRERPLSVLPSCCRSFRRRSVHLPFADRDGPVIADSHPGPRGGRSMSAAPRGSCLALSPRRGGQRGDRRGSAVQRPRPMRGSCSVPLPWLPFLRLSRRGFLLAVAELCARSPARLSTQPSRGAWARARPLLRSATQRPSQAAHRASPSLGTGGMLRLQ
jgi:hypothetical protein